jgi:3-deoxy-D-manno-octulosonate 8-phosphate phosphatase (KDO 8-P phosphatase)
MRDLASPALNFSPELLLAAQAVRIAFFDVDGVFTDGGLYLSDHGETLKRFHILDGLGVKLLQRAGITPVVITGRDSLPLRARLASLGLSWSQAAAIGDDWPDLPVLTRCAFPVAPAQAHAEVRARARYVTQAVGGEGAVREFCDLLLVAGGHYAGLLESYR